MQNPDTAVSPLSAVIDRIERLVAQMREEALELPRPARRGGRSHLRVVQGGSEVTPAKPPLLVVLETHPQSSSARE